jgi:two-component system response regulator RegA
MSNETASASIPQSVLVVDDDDAFRTRVAKGLAERGFDVRTAGNASEAMDVARKDPPEFAVVDLRMPGASGLTLIDELRALDPTTRVVVLTGWGSVGTAVDAMKRGAVHYLQKPVTLDTLVGTMLGEDQQPGEPAQDLPTLARLEWEYIQRVMAECADNVSEAARRLHMHRRSLQRKLQKRPPAR